MDDSLPFKFILDSGGGQCGGGGNGDGPGGICTVGHVGPLPMPKPGVTTIAGSVDITLGLSPGCAVYLIP